MRAEDLFEVLPQFAGRIPQPETWKQLGLLLSESQSLNPDLASKILDYFDSITDVVVRKKLTGAFFVANA